MDPAERQVFCLTDAEVEELARQAVIIEKHYGRPMDVEWAKDGDDNGLYIVQARPETVQSRADTNVMESYVLKGQSEILVEGRAIGQKIGRGPVKVLASIDEMDQVEEGDILVTDMTDPDWEPVMKRASAIVTNRGGRMLSRSDHCSRIGIPAVVGAGDATEQPTTGQSVTVSCAEGDTGFVYEGLLEFDHLKRNIAEMPDLPFKIMMNVGNPDRAFAFAGLPNAGIGLARLNSSLTA